MRREVFDTSGIGHFGSSDSLAEGFLDLLEGRPSRKNANIRAGFVSAMTCLAAQDSIRSGEPVPLNF